MVRSYRTGLAVVFQKDLYSLHGLKNIFRKVENRDQAKLAIHFPEGQFHAERIICVVGNQHIKAMDFIGGKACDYRLCLHGSYTTDKEESTEIDRQQTAGYSSIKHNRDGAERVSYKNGFLTSRLKYFQRFPGTQELSSLLIALVKPDKRILLFSDWLSSGSVRRREITEPAFISDITLGTTSIGAKVA